MALVKHFTKTLKTSSAPFKNRRILKLLSLLLSLIFTGDTIAWSAPSLANSMAAVSAGTHSSAAFFDSLKIPDSLGTVESQFVPTVFAGQTPILYIQDAHAHPEAQRNIQLLLKSLADQKKIKAIGLEAAVGKVDASGFYFFPVPEANRAVYDDLAAQGELTGAELFALESKMPGIPLIGVDDLKLYRQSYNAYQKVISLKKPARDILNSYSAELEKITAKLPADLGRILRTERSWDGGTDHLEYFNALKDLALKHLKVDFTDARAQFEWPNLTRLMIAGKIQNGMKPENLSKDILQLTDLLKEQTIEAGTKKFLTEGLQRMGNPQAGKEFREWLTINSKAPGIPTARVFMELLYAELRSAKISLVNYPALLDWAGLRILQEELNASQLMKEAGLAQALLEKKLAVTGKQKRAVELIKDFRTLEKMLSLTLTREDYDRFKKRRKELTGTAFSKRFFAAARKSLRRIPQGLLRRAEVFYRLSEKRDRVLFENTLKLSENSRNSDKAVVLIAGGFHTSGLKALFEENQIPYLTLTPHMSLAGDEQLYEQVMMGKHGAESKANLSANGLGAWFLLTPNGSLPKRLRDRQRNVPLAAIRREAVKMGWSEPRIQEMIDGKMREKGVGVASFLGGRGREISDGGVSSDGIAHRLSKGKQTRREPQQISTLPFYASLFDTSQSASMIPPTARISVTDRNPSFKHRFGSFFITSPMTAAMTNAWNKVSKVFETASILLWLQNVFIIRETIIAWRPSIVNHKNHILIVLKSLPSLTPPASSPPRSEARQPKPAKKVTKKETKRVNKKPAKKRKPSEEDLKIAALVIQLGDRRPGFGDAAALALLIRAEENPEALIPVLQRAAGSPDEKTRENANWVLDWLDKSNLAKPSIPDRDGKPSQIRSEVRGEGKKTPNSDRSIKSEIKRIDDLLRQLSGRGVVADYSKIQGLLAALYGGSAQIYFENPSRDKEAKGFPVWTKREHSFKWGLYALNKPRDGQAPLYINKRQKKKIKELIAAVSTQLEAMKIYPLRTFSSKITGGSIETGAILTAEPKFKNPFFHTFLGETVDGVPGSVAQSRIERVFDLLELTPAQKNYVRSFDNIFIPVLKLGETEPFVIRAQHKNVRGPNKGGIRLVFDDTLKNDPHFMHLFNELKDELTLQELRYFLRKYVFEETLPLSFGMTSKTAVAGLPYGGGKGTMLAADIYLDEDGTPEIRSNYKASDANHYLHSLARGFARVLQQSGTVEWDRDIPAADLNSARFMDVMADEHVEAVFEALEARAAFKSLRGENLEFIKKLRAITRHTGDSLFKPNYLQAVTEYMNALRDKKRAVPSVLVPLTNAVAAYTSKSKDLSGSIFRPESTGFGGIHVLKEVVIREGKSKSPEKPLEGMTAKLMGFGGVGLPAAEKMIQEGMLLEYISVGPEGGVMKKGGFKEQDLSVLKKNWVETHGFYWLNSKDEYTIAGAVYVSKEQMEDLSEAGKENNFLGYPADVFVLAAVENAIHLENVAQSEGGIYLELANGAITNEAYDRLIAGNHIVIADSLANAGGVTVSYYEQLQNLKNERWELERIQADMEASLSRGIERADAVRKKYETDWRTAADTLMVQYLLATAKQRKTQKSARSEARNQPTAEEVAAHNLLYNHLSGRNSPKVPADHIAVVLGNPYDHYPAYAANAVRVLMSPKVIIVGKGGQPVPEWQRIRNEMTSGNDAYLRKRMLVNEIDASMHTGANIDEVIKILIANKLQPKNIALVQIPTGLLLARRIFENQWEEKAKTLGYLGPKPFFYTFAVARPYSFRANHRVTDRALFYLKQMTGQVQRLKDWPHLDKPLIAFQSEDASPEILEAAQTVEHLVQRIEAQSEVRNDDTAFWVAAGLVGAISVGWFFWRVRLGSKREKHFQAFQDVEDKINQKEQAREKLRFQVRYPHAVGKVEAAIDLFVEELNTQNPALPYTVSHIDWIRLQTAIIEADAYSAANLDRNVTISIELTQNAEEAALTLLAGGTDDPRTKQHELYYSIQIKLPGRSEARVTDYLDTYLETIKDNSEEFKRTLKVIDRIRKKKEKKEAEEVDLSLNPSESTRSMSYKILPIEEMAENFVKNYHVGDLPPAMRAAVALAFFDAKKFPEVHKRLTQIIQNVPLTSLHADDYLGQFDYRKVIKIFSRAENKDSVDSNMLLRFAFNKVVFDMPREERRILEKEAMIYELERELRKPGSSDLPQVVFLTDLHGAPHVGEFIAYALGLKNYKGVKTVADLERKLAAEDIRIEDKNILFVGGSDYVDRGPKPYWGFQLIKWLREKEKLKFINGNHDIWKDWHLLGMHLRVSDKLQAIALSGHSSEVHLEEHFRTLRPFVSTVTLNEEEARKVEAALRGVIKNFLAVIRERRLTDDVLAEFSNLIIDMGKNPNHSMEWWARDWGEHGNWFDTLYDQMNEMMINDAIHQINQYAESHREVLTKIQSALTSLAHAEAVSKGRLFHLIDVSSWMNDPEVKALKVEIEKIKKENAATRKENEVYAAKGEFEKIKFQKRVPSAFNLTSVLAVKTWREILRQIKLWNEIIPGLDLPAPAIELINENNSRQNSQVMETALWDFKNFRLTYTDIYGNLYVHGIIPLNEDASDFKVKYKLENGRVLKGLEAIERIQYDVRRFFEKYDEIPDKPEFREKVYEELGPAFEVINEWYSDVLGYLKPDNIKKFVEAGGPSNQQYVVASAWAPRVFEGKKGFVGHGHVDLAKLRDKKIGLPWWSGEGMAGDVIHADFEMSPEYSGRGGFFSLFMNRDGQRTGAARFGYKETVYSIQKAVKELRKEIAKADEEQKPALESKLADLETVLTGFKNQPPDIENLSLFELPEHQQKKVEPFTAGQGFARYYLLRFLEENVDTYRQLSIDAREIFGDRKRSEYYRRKWQAETEKLRLLNAEFQLKEEKPNDSSPAKSELRTNRETTEKPAALEKGWVIANHILVAFHSAFISSVLSISEGEHSKANILTFLFFSPETIISLLFWYLTYHIAIWWHERGHYWQAVSQRTLREDLLEEAWSAKEEGGWKWFVHEARMLLLSPFGKFPGVQRVGLGYQVESPFNLSVAAAGPRASGQLAMVMLPMAGILIPLGLWGGFEIILYIGRLALGLGAVSFLDRMLADPKFREAVAFGAPEDAFTSEIMAGSGQIMIDAQQVHVLRRRNRLLVTGNAWYDNVTNYAQNYLRILRQMAEILPVQAVDAAKSEVRTAANTADRWPVAPEVSSGGTKGGSSRAVLTRSEIRSNVIERRLTIREETPLRTFLSRFVGVEGPGASALKIVSAKFKPESGEVTVFGPKDLQKNIPPGKGILTVVYPRGISALVNSKARQKKFYELIINRLVPEINKAFQQYVPDATGILTENARVGNANAKEAFRTRDGSPVGKLKFLSHLIKISIVQTGSDFQLVFTPLVDIPGLTYKPKKMIVPAEHEIHALIKEWVYGLSPNEIKKLNDKGRFFTKLIELYERVAPKKPALSELRYVSSEPQRYINLYSRIAQSGRDWSAVRTVTEVSGKVADPELIDPLTRPEWNELLFGETAVIANPFPGVEKFRSALNAKGPRASNEAPRTVILVDSGRGGSAFTEQDLNAMELSAGSRVIVFESRVSSENLWNRISRFKLPARIKRQRIHFEHVLPTERELAAILEQTPGNMPIVIFPAMTPDSILGQYEDNENISAEQGFVASMPKTSDARFAFSYLLGHSLPASLLKDVPSDDLLSVTVRSNALSKAYVPVWAEGRFAKWAVERMRDRLFAQAA